MNFIEILKIIGAALGGLVGISGFIVAIVKPLRKSFVNWIICNTGSENMAKEIHDYLYPEEEYQVSETVKSVSDKIEQIADTPNEIVE